MNTTKEAALTEDALESAVLVQLGMDPENLTEDDKTLLQDVADHGADAGWSGFIYHSETCEFYRNNKDAILELAKDQSESLGTNTLSEFIAEFNCLKNYSAFEVESYLMTEDPDHYDIPNALAWFALEEVARLVCEEQE